MPEGDTVRRTANRLHEALAGKPLTRAELRWPSLGDIYLTGSTVAEVTAYGKHILTRLITGSSEPLTLHSHLRMEGSWRIEATTASSWPPTSRLGVRAVLENAEWTALGLTLGMLDLLPTAAESTLIGHLGPDILAADFADPTRAAGITEAVRRLRAQPDRQVGAALLDQRNLAGIGTMYMAEVLFAAGVSPWTPINQIADLPRVVDTARRMLAANVQRAVQSTTGDLRPGNRQWVHARSGRPCLRCGTTVRVAPIEVHPPSPGQTAGLERTAFYCPHCQPGPTPTDDGRPQQPLGAARSGGTKGYRRT